MVDIDRLIQAMPVMHLSADTIARVTNLPGPQSEFKLFEPPAGRKIPYADAVPFLETLGTMEGARADEAASHARRAWSALRPSLDPLDRAVRLDPEDLLADQEGAPVPLLLELARSEGIATYETAFGWGRALDAVDEAPLFPDLEQDGPLRKLRDLSEQPRPHEWLEYLIGLPYGIDMALKGRKPWELQGVEYHHMHAFLEWREAIRPSVVRLEERLGRWVYDFADFTCEYDDDSGHRFLALHMLASLLPQCPFVRYLVEVSGVDDVEELRTALLEPTNYPLPFVSWDSFGGKDSGAVVCDWRSCRSL